MIQAAPMVGHTYGREGAFRARVTVTDDNGASAERAVMIRVGGNSGGTDAGLDPNAPPGSNFELIDWSLNTPADEDDDGVSDRIDETDLADGFEDPDYFYTGPDGGMVFRTTVAGARTSSNTHYVRTELREMLRRGDTSIETRNSDGTLNANNWALSTAPDSATEAAGGVDGVLEATVAVNHVTTTGSDSQVGRVVIGQIHAKDDEPARLYYRKLPGNAKGSVYFAHEPSGGSDKWIELIGSRSSSASDPKDGIALNEKFSYRIEAAGNTLTVTILRDGEPDVAASVDMSDSGYDVADDFLYFKAGAYTQNDTGDSDDYDQVTFYKLTNTHTGYPY